MTILFLQVQSCDRCVLSAAWHWLTAIWWPDRNWRKGKCCECFHVCL